LNEKGLSHLYLIINNSSCKFSFNYIALLRQLSYMYNHNHPLDEYSMRHGRMLNMNFIFQNCNRLPRNIFDTSIYWCYCTVLRSLECRSKSHSSSIAVLEWYILMKKNRILYLLCYHIFIHRSIDRHRTYSKSFLHFGFQ
jgi:hypothetical protein